MRRLWETALGKRLDHRRVLTPTQTSTYLKEALNLRLVQAGGGTKSYSSGNYVAEDHDTALFWGVEARHGEKAALIAPKKALAVYEPSGSLELISESKTFGEVLSSNAFADESLGIVSGSPHPGDPTFQREAALMGFSIESNGEKGEAKSYGEHGDPIYHHFVHNQVLQAICRFGRDADGATVYINTTAIPDWLTFDKKVNPELFAGKKAREIAACLREYGEEGATQQILADETDCSKRYVRDRLNRLVDAGYVKKHEYAGRDGQHIYVLAHLS